MLGTLLFPLIASSLNLETILYIVIAAIISLIVTVFIYGYKTKYTS